MSDELIILDIEERLAQDCDGVEKKKLEKILNEQIGVIDKSLSKGMKPEEHQKNSTLLNGLKVALEVLNLYWSSVHRRDNSS